MTPPRTLAARRRANNLRIALPRQGIAAPKARRNSAPQMQTPTPDWVHDARQAADYLAVYEAKKHKKQANRLDVAGALTPYSPGLTPMSAPAIARSPTSPTTPTFALTPPTPATAPATSFWGNPSRRRPSFELARADALPEPTSRGELLRRFLAWLLDELISALCYGFFHALCMLGNRGACQR